MCVLTRCGPRQTADAICQGHFGRYLEWMPRAWGLALLASVLGTRFASPGQPIFLMIHPAAAPDVGGIGDAKAGRKGLRAKRGRGF